MVFKTIILHLVAKEHPHKSNFLMLQKMSNSTSRLTDIFHFTSVEDRPLLESNKNTIVAVVCLMIMIVGLLVNSRVYNILAKPRKAAAMDQLLKFNNIISLICHPLILIYYIVSTTVSPVSDYIGVAGCLFTVHLLDAFTRFYNFTFPVAVALLRYLFVVEHMKVKAIGMNFVNKTFSSSRGPCKIIAPQLSILLSSIAFKCFFQIS